MPIWLLDLLAWTAAFIVLFFVIRYLQRRKKDGGDGSDKG